MSADYLPRSEGGRRLLSVSCSVNIERRSLQCHVSNSQKKLLKVAQKYIKADELGPKEYKNQRREERTRDWQEKPLHGRFLRCTKQDLGMVEERRTEERNRGSDYCSARPVSADECNEGKD